MPRGEKTCHKFWSDEELRQEALKYETRYEFQLESPNANRVAHRRGLIDEICSHMKTLRKDWTDEELREEALKYKTRNSLKTHNQKVYAAIRKRGIQDYCYSHMVSIKDPSDSVYIWKVKGLPVYKIGVTRSDLNDTRFKRVANAGNLEVEYVVCCKVEKPFTVETTLLSKGRPFSFDEPFDGHTEFRNLTWEEYEVCVDILLENEVSDA